MLKSIHSLFNDRLEKGGIGSGRKPEGKDIERAAKKIISRVGRWTGVRTFAPNYLSNEVARHVALNPHLKGYEKDIYDSIKNRMGA